MLIGVGQLIARRFGKHAHQGNVAATDINYRSFVRTFDGIIMVSLGCLGLERLDHRVV
ncbi:hypothetical protein M422DRAFT_26022, partial [Sphaerobolus stellatus SS14]